jgi:F0F1-type ATP synthase delta subunit
MHRRGFGGVTRRTCFVSYVMDVHEKLKALLNDETLTNDEKKKAARKDVKKVLEERCVAVIGMVVSNSPLRLIPLSFLQIQGSAD